MRFTYCDPGMQGRAQGLVIRMYVFVLELRRAAKLRDETYGVESESW